MTEPATAQLGPVPASESQTMQQSVWKRWFGHGNGNETTSETPQDDHDDQQRGEEPQRPGVIRRVSRKVVPGLPRAQTFKRQQAEVRNNLEPIQPTPAERRAVSVERRPHVPHNPANPSNPRSSAPDFAGRDALSSAVSAPSIAGSALDEKMLDNIDDLDMSDGDDIPRAMGAASVDDAASMTTSQYDALIHDELERIWILNLSMHFRDKSKREKFFVTYREKEEHWRRVTISLDYRGAPDNSLEMDLIQIKFQRDKSAKIYEAIRDSLQDIQFYETVTNLKLQTTDGRLHVHVVEDVNEIIHYPTTRMVQHLKCRHVKESDIEFESHMSGFVYKVKVNGETLIKKEIPGPDTVDEFLYEINALSQLCYSRNVIKFYGVVVDDYGEYVKGLLIDYADRGALIDVIYDGDHGLSWPRREKWARQIVEGLSEVHEAGFVQGDFTLSNIVVDHRDNAKIIDINRRGCPVGWEPPEATPLIESSQRISMYIGVKSDLYQLGMVLWALAEQEDEPESHGRPLTLSEGSGTPDWYKAVVRICLAEHPRYRVQAIDLLRLFPPSLEPGELEPPSISVDDGYLVQDYLVSEYQTGEGPTIRTVQAPKEWDRGDSYGQTYVDAPSTLSSEPYYYPTRGRSPPSPMPSNLDYCEPRWAPQVPPWTYPRERSFERRRSSSGFDFAPNALMSGDGDEDGDLEKISVDDEAPGPSFTVDKFAATKQELVSHSQEEEETDFATANSVSLDDPDTRSHGQTKASDDIVRAAGPTMATREETRTEESSEPTRSTLKSDDRENTALQNKDDAFRSNGNGKGIHDFNPIKTSNNNRNTTPTPQNPLFREAEPTESEAPRTIAALVSRAAEIQNTTSASTIVDTKQDREDDGQIDSAIEMNITSSSSSSNSPGERFSPRRNVVPDALLHLGSGHEASFSAPERKGSASTIAEDDLEGA
ncbi:hypothetical protein N0V93_007522 [Gnomoniopsis smithogilvyi]|uniref:Protein kinase domain-containing protein n=1 Tax=Gnomoniopsis smithogilvyi TaxID=1191159 RepID=A0A9W9CVR8_9PEZI|nr:hypothetical protein N0V93_007522 [Gnomoniopsis smithogilvyi]